MYALAVLNGKLYAGGWFDPPEIAGLAASIACWDPATSTWSDLGSGMAVPVGYIDPPYVYALAALNGRLYAGGSFTIAGGVSANRIACWNPETSTWSPLGSGMSSGCVYALLPLGGKLYVGGYFNNADGVSANHIARWDPETSTWSPLGSGVSNGGFAGAVRALATLDGKLYVGGDFTGAGGGSANGIACWDPASSTWSALGSGVGGGDVHSLATLNDTLYVGGDFTTAGGEVSVYWARWGAGPRADFDCDLDVDGDDLDTFEACASGPGIEHNGSPACQTADSDRDDDVDQADFGIFQRCLSGEGVVADPNCAG